MLGLKERKITSSGPRCIVPRLPRPVGRNSNRSYSWGSGWKRGWEQHEKREKYLLIAALWLLLAPIGVPSSFLLRPLWSLVSIRMLHARNAWDRDGGAILPRGLQLLETGACMHRNLRNVSEHSSGEKHCWSALSTHRQFQQSAKIKRLWTRSWS